MPFCASCGAQVEGRFCAKCGSPVAAAPTPPPPGNPSAGAVPPMGAAPAGPGYQYQPVAASGMSDNVASALCYLVGLITGILFLVLTPYNQNRTIRFHAFQSIFLNVAWIVVWIGLSVLMGILHIAGLFFGLFLTPLIGLAFFVLWIYMMIAAYQGKMVVLPVIGPLAQQQAG